MKPGKLTVIVGPVRSEKSTTLYRYLSRALRAKKTVSLFTHLIDKRWKGQQFTHSGLSLKSLGVTRNYASTSRDILEGVKDDVDLLVVEEAQFFDLDLPLVVDKLRDKGITVVVAGLDMSSEGYPMGSMGHLMCNATKVRKLTAICECGRKATRTLSLFEKKSVVEVGGEEKYAPACHRCWANKGKQWGTKNE